VLYQCAYLILYLIKIIWDYLLIVWKREVGKQSENHSVGRKWRLQASFQWPLVNLILPKPCSAAGTALSLKSIFSLQHWMSKIKHSASLNPGPHSNLATPTSAWRRKRDLLVLGGVVTTKVDWEGQREEAFPSWWTLKICLGATRFHFPLCHLWALHDYRQALIGSTPALPTGTFPTAASRKDPEEVQERDWAAQGCRRGGNGSRAGRPHDCRERRRTQAILTVTISHCAAFPVISPHSHFVASISRLGN
jgi:hypothetical protein